MVDDRPEEQPDRCPTRTGPSARRPRSISRRPKSPARPRSRRAAIRASDACDRDRTCRRRAGLRAGLRRRRSRPGSSRRLRRCCRRAGDRRRLDAGLARVQPAHAGRAAAQRRRDRRSHRARRRRSRPKVSKPAAPVADPAAAAARIDALEKSLAALRGELATAARAKREACRRRQRGEIRAARRRLPPAPDLSAINERLAQIESAAAGAGRRDRAARQQDRRRQGGRCETCRRCAAAPRRGGSPARRSGSDTAIPIAAALAAAKSLAPNADALKPLDELCGRRACRTPHSSQPRIADAGAEIVAGGAAGQCHLRFGHRRSAAGGRGQSWSASSAPTPPATIAAPWSRG